MLFISMLDGVSSASTVFAHQELHLEAEPAGRAAPKAVCLEMVNMLSHSSFDKEWQAKEEAFDICEEWHNGAFRQLLLCQTCLEVSLTRRSSSLCSARQARKLKFGML